MRHPVRSTGYMTSGLDAVCSSGTPCRDGLEQLQIAIIHIKVMLHQRPRAGQRTRKPHGDADWRQTTCL